MRVSKNLTVLIFLILMSAGIKGQVHPEGLFEEANKDYQEGNYELAAGKYLKIDSMGFQSAELYFNLANACFRSNKTGKARLYYERAALISPNDRDIRANLEFLESMLTDKFEPVPEFFLKTWLKSFVRMFHPDRWAIISMIGFALFFAGSMLYIFSRRLRIRKAGFYAGIIFLLISVAGFSISRLLSAHLLNPGTAVMTEASQVVKSAPRQSGKDLFILHEGTKIWLENSLDQWQEVRIADGRKGWIPAGSFEKI